MKNAIIVKEPGPKPVVETKIDRKAASEAMEMLEQIHRAETVKLHRRVAELVVAISEAKRTIHELAQMEQGHNKKPDLA